MLQVATLRMDVIHATCNKLLLLRGTFSVQSTYENLNLVLKHPFGLSYYN